jgi:hypothetical protein
MNRDPSHRLSPDALAAALGFGLLALTTVVPLLVGRRRFAFLDPDPDGLPATLGRVGVLLALAVVVVVRTRLDRRTEPRPAAITLVLLVLSGIMTAAHWLIVDSDPVRWWWQYEVYLDSLGHGVKFVPHSYRPLPCGFVRLVEALTGDRMFACLAYRWFFNGWLLWASYRLARLYHRPALALLAVLPVVVLHPASIWYYYGQLTDPLNHTLFVLGLVYVLERRPVPLAASLALGVAAKETIVLLVPVYLACWWRRGLRALAEAAVPAAAAVASYLAVRVPLGWRPGLRNVNGLDELMLGTNLGLGEPVALTVVPLWVNYLHPIVFVGPFLVVIACRWRRIDARLRTACLTLTPLLLASNACFGWLYESRNYVPLLPLLAAAALPARREGSVAAE